MMTTKKYFAAFSGGDGFGSRFGEIFSPRELSVLYIIKGGPGTGKSTFMRKIGKAAEERGMSPEYYFCSSDPSSLDGVMIREISAAIVDGTAPHVTEAAFPGACERVLDFTSALDNASLMQSRRKIEELTAESAESYSAAYAHLRAAKIEKLLEMSLFKNAYDAKKARAFAERLVSRMKCGGNEREYITSTFCREGFYRLKAMPLSAKSVYTVGEGSGGYLMMADILTAARERGVMCAFSRDPILSELISEIYIESEGVYICCEREAALDMPEKKTINMRRFLSRDELCMRRAPIREARKIQSAMCLAAKNRLAAASAAHDELERIYSENTDFSVIDAMLCDVIKELFEK